MIIISATELKDNIFQYIDEIIKGKTIIIQHNQKNVVRLTPVSEPDWRNKMTIRPKLLVSPEKIIEPIALEMIDSVNLPDIHKDPFQKVI